MSESTPGEHLDRARVAALSLDRLRSTAMLLTLSVPTGVIYAAVHGPLSLGISSAAITVAVAAVWWVCARGRFPPAHGAAGIFGVWMLTVGNVLWLRVATQDRAATFVLALMVVGYGAVQLERRWVLVAYGVAPLAWLGLGFAPAVQFSDVEPVSLLAGVAIGYLLFRAHTRFLTDTETMRAVAESRSAALAAALAAAEREIADRKRAEDEREHLRDQFRQAQKMEAVGTLAGGVVHDINNVLTGIMSLAELARDDATGRVRDDLDQIVASCQRGAALTRSLLSFSRRDPQGRGPVAVDALVQRVVALLERTLPKRVRIGSELTSRLAVDADGDQVIQALINLCTNAVDAMPDGGTLTLFTRSAELRGDHAVELGLAPGTYAAITVNDTGQGMDAATRARMFEPFFTTKPIGKGTGLGLAMVHGTVTALRGALDVVTAPGTGTAVTMYLPASDAVVEEPAPAAAPTAGARHRVLVVDDEAVVRTMTRRVLEKAGLDVVVADGGAAALDAYRRGPAFAAVVMDMAMPGMSGAQCFRALRELDPQARVLLVSGYADQRDLQSCLAEGAVGFVAKPFDRARLVAAVDDAVAGRVVGMGASA